MGRGLPPNGKIYYLSLSINPFGQTGASRSASGVCKRERERDRGRMGASQTKRGRCERWRGTGAVGTNEKGWGENWKKTTRVREWFDGNTYSNVAAIQQVMGKQWLNDWVKKDEQLVRKLEQCETMRELDEVEIKWRTYNEWNYSR